MMCRDRNEGGALDPAPSPSTSTPWAKPDYSLKGTWGFRAKEKVICMCEGAKYCTRENPAKQRGGNAINGLHSSWVMDTILAMARPWQENVVKLNMVAAFVDANIGMVLNLQEVGEHDSCGPGNLAHTGFSYDPESFTSAGIGFYNFSWRDMGVPDLDRMMDIVQVMDYVANTEGRKIAVHCHAGLGRTGLAIACFFVFTKLQSAKSAVTTVRLYRQGALQTSAQVLFVSVFEQYISYLRCVFGGSGNFLPQKGGGSYLEGLGHAPEQSPASWGGGLAGALPPRINGHSHRPHPTSTSSRSGSPAPKPALSHSGSGAGADRGSGSDHSHKELSHQLSHQSQGKSTPKPLSRSGSFTESLSGVVSSLVKSRSNRVSCSGSTTPTHTEPVEVKVQGGMRTETYHSGLTIVKPIKAGSFEDSQGVPDQSSGPAYLINDHDLGLDNSKLPWNQHFHITPASFSPGWLPEPPRSYEEALHRQQRLVHGQRRRVFLNLHMFLKEACFVVISAAEAHEGGASARSAPDQQQGGASAGPAISSFADAVAACLEPRGVGRPSSSLVESLAQHPGLGKRFLGSVNSSSGMQEVVTELKQHINHHDYSSLPKAPLLAVLLLIDDFFASFEPSSSCLSAEALKVVAEEYEVLPFGEEVQGGEEEEKQYTWAKQLFSRMKPSDQELLLLLSALLRHIIRASSGPGCEEPMVQVAKWMSCLLLGEVAAGSEKAQEAVLSFLWFLVTNDVAYASLILVKERRDVRVVGSAGNAAPKPPPSTIKLHAPICPPAEVAPPQLPLGAILSPQESAKASIEANPKCDQSSPFKDGKQILPTVSRQVTSGAGGAEAGAGEAPPSPESETAAPSPEKMPESQEPSPAKGASPAKEPSPAKEASQAKEAIPAKEANPAKEASASPTASPAKPGVTVSTPASSSTGLAHSTDSLPSPTPSHGAPSTPGHRPVKGSAPPTKNLLLPKKAKVHLPPLPRQSNAPSPINSGGGASLETSTDKLPATTSVHNVWKTDS